MTNTNVAPAANIKTESPPRIVPVNRPKRESMQKIDFVGIISAWKVQTRILDQIKRNEAKTSFKVKITPEMALDILTLNDMEHNRDIDRRRIKQYTTAMEFKRWKENNGDTIRISREMKLLDGQHRLWSIWLSKQSYEYLIVTGLEPDTFAYIDNGKQRSGTDTTKINGFGAIAAPITAAIKMCILFEKRGITQSSIGGTVVANWEINDWEQDEKRMAWMIKAHSMIKETWMKQTKDYFTSAQWLAVFYILRFLPNNKAKQAEEFLNAFAEGSDLPRTSPIKVCRTYFEKEMEQFIRGKKRKTVEKNILTVKLKVLFAAWDLHLAKATCSEIKIDVDNPIIPKPKWSAKDVQ